MDSSMKAFTLIEVLIAVALVVLMLVVLTSFFISANATYEQQRSTIEQDQRVRLVADRTEELLREARSVIEVHTFASGVRASNDQVLVLSVPAIDENGEIQDGYLDYIALYRESGDIHEEIDAAPGSVRESGQRILVSSIAELTFGYDAAPASEVRAVTIGVVAEALVREQAVRGEVRQTLYLRNAP